MSKRVDVIIPTFNRGRTIERAINSVLKQTYTDVRAIVVDDGSTDNTCEVMSKYHTDRVVYLQQEINRGACSARNIGIKYSDSDYIAFLDSDDEWMEDKLEKQLLFLENSNCDITFCSYYRIEKNNKILYPDKEYKGDIHEQLLYGNFLSNGVVLGKRDCFVKEPFDEDLPRLQDWDIMLRLSREYVIKHQHIPLAYYYVQPDSITMNHYKLKKALDIISQKYEEEFSRNEKAMARLYRQEAVASIMTDGDDSYSLLKLANGLDFSPKWFAIEIMCFFRLSGLIKAMKTKSLSKRL